MENYTENYIECRINSIKVYENLNEITFEIEDKWGEVIGSINIKDSSKNKIKSMLLEALDVQ